MFGFRTSERGFRNMGFKSRPSEIISLRYGHMFIFKPLNTRNVFLMKKVLFTSLFLACAAMGLSSCMNGDYDANPNANNGTTNPLANNGGGGSGGGGGGTGGGSGPGTAAKGEIRFRLNGSSNVTFTGSNYTIVGTTDPLISGGNTGTTGSTTINVFILNYTGPGTYAFTGTSATSTHGTYTISPFGSSDDTYNTATGTPTGTGQVVVTSDANNELVGTFSFTAYNSTGGKTDVTSGSFDVVKM